MTSGIPGGKLYPLLGQLVDMRSLVKGRALTSHIGPTQIIDQKEDNIELLFFLGVKSKTAKEQTY